MKYIHLFIAVFGTASSALAQNRLYVNHAATGANNGQSWQGAYTDLQVALLTAQAGDEVWVAEGTYRPTNTTDRNVSFEPRSGVRLYGGFVGTEANLAQRDWSAHPTVLSGDISTVGDSTDNSYNVVYLFEPDTNTVLDGFTLRDGNADYSSAATARDRRRCGGGLYIMGEDADAYPDIHNCLFLHNTARGFGGGVMANGGGDGSVAPRFVNCRFEANRVVGSGGGLARIGGSWLERGRDLYGCIFVQNQAGFNGGGFYYSDSERTDRLEIEGCFFGQNTAEHWGGGTCLLVGRSDPAEIYIRKSSFHKNSAAKDGGAFKIYPASFSYVDFIEIDSCLFEDNILKNGPAGLITFAVVYIDQVGLEDPKGELSNSVFRDNRGWTSIFLSGGEARFNVDKCLFSGNSAIGELFFVAPSPNTFTTISNSTFTQNKDINSVLSCISAGNFLCHNCLLADNIIKYGGFFGPGYSDTFFLKNITMSGNTLIDLPFHPILQPKNMIIENCTLDGIANTSSLIWPNETAYIGHSFFDSLDCQAWPFSLFLTCGPGLIIGGDPMFVNPDSGDYRLQPCSPLRDSGSNAAVAGILTDLAGNPRVLGGTVDIGAYEAAAFAFAAPPTIKAACDSAATGSVAVAPANGCEPYTYHWQPGGQAGPSLDGLLPGIYQVTVTDAQGRSASDTATVTAAPSPTLLVEGEPVSCFGASDAVLSASPLSGQPPFQYVWSEGTTDSVAAGLGPGPVSVTVTDAFGCTASFSFDVPEPDTLQFTATVQDASAPQSADGSVTVNSVSGGTPPYHYLWEPGGGASDIISNLLPGLYTLSVTDERGCEAAWAFEVKFVVGASDMEGRAVLLICPNPAGETATLAGDFQEARAPERLELYDAAGRLARSLALSGASGEQTWQVPLGGLAAGTYSVLLCDTEGKVVGTGKLVKQ